jgi:hypothetical protein
MRAREVILQLAAVVLAARRTCADEAPKKKGELRFVDLGVRHMFYYYSNMKHVVVDEKALERPWLPGEPQ